MDDLGLAEARARVRQIEGADVVMCAFDYQVHLSLRREHEADQVLQLATSFELLVDGTTHTIDPTELGDHVAPALRLFMRSVESATIDEARTLVIRFRPTATLTISPDLAYEAWQLNDARGLRLVCHSVRFWIG